MSITSFKDFSLPAAILFSLSLSPRRLFPMIRKSFFFFFICLYMVGEKLTVEPRHIVGVPLGPSKRFHRVGTAPRRRDENSVLLFLLTDIYIYFRPCHTFSCRRSLPPPEPMCHISFYLFSPSTDPAFIFISLDNFFKKWENSARLLILIHSINIYF